MTEVRGGVRGYLEMQRAAFDEQAQVLTIEGGPTAGTEGSTVEAADAALKALGYRRTRKWRANGVKVRYWGTSVLPLEEGGQARGDQ